MAGNYCFKKDDLVHVLKNVPPSKKYKKKCKNLLEEVANETKSTYLSATDLIHLEENYSGTRLTAQLRKNVHGLMPTHKEVKAQKKMSTGESSTQFSSLKEYQLDGGLTLRGCLKYCHLDITG